MLGVFKIKSLLIAVVVAATGAGWWTQRQVPSPIATPTSTPISEPVVRVPVEIIAKGSPPELVYVDIGNQAVPEPGAITLGILAGTLLAIRRRRE